MTRDEALDKIRKLLAMANDGRGNVNEAANAASMASKLMAKFQIDSAETMLGKIDEEELAQEWVRASGHAGAKEHAYREVPLWCQWVGVGVAQLFDCKIDLCSKGSEGIGVRYSGFRTDVTVATWMFVYLVDQVNRASEEVSGRSEKANFKKGAGSVLQRRLKELLAERNTEFKAAGTGTALVVVNNKLARIQEEFGQQTFKKSNSSITDRDAYARGMAAGARINLNTNRPLEGGSNHARIAQ